jgi:glycerophosphoryl diester phosphodiesterase
MKSRINKNSWLLNTPIAHRGLHNETYGENSMGAFKNAIEKGCPIEMDIQLSKDGVLLCFHDDSFERVCGKKAFVNDLTYEEIKQLKILNTQEGVPTFEEFLKEI